MPFIEEAGTSESKLQSAIWKWEQFFKLFFFILCYEWCSTKLFTIAQTCPTIIVMFGGDIHVLFQVPTTFVNFSIFVI